jgi:hypothetical protein
MKSAGARAAFTQPGGAGALAGTHRAARTMHTANPRATELIRRVVLLYAGNAPGGTALSADFLGRPAARRPA